MWCSSMYLAILVLEGQNLSCLALFVVPYMEVTLYEVISLFTEKCHTFESLLLR